MRKGVILIVGFILVIICLSISIGYNDLYQRRKRYPYYKDEPINCIKSTLWLGIGVTILYLSKLLMENV